MISVVIPAHDEAKTVGGVVRSVREHALVSEVIVVANACTDATQARARDAGALVVECPELGFGRAIKAGFKVASQPFVLKTDGDITNWSSEWVTAFTSAEADLVRGIFESPYDEFPVTNLAVRPLLKLFRPELYDLPRLLTGQYLVRRAALSIEAFPDDWSFDLCVLMTALEKGLSIADVDIGVLDDTKRTIDYYVPMAIDLMRYLLVHFGVSPDLQQPSA